MSVRASTSARRASARGSCRRRSRSPAPSRVRSVSAPSSRARSRRSSPRPSSVIDHVRRLHVAVHDPGVVRALKPFRDLGEVRRALRHRQRTALDLLLERHAFVVRHRDEELSRVGLADLVDGADVRVIERGGGFGFLDEAPLGLVVGAEVWRQKLERDRSVEPERPPPCRPRPCRRRRASRERGSGRCRRPGAAPPSSSTAVANRPERRRRTGLRPGPRPDR